MQAFLLRIVAFCCRKQFSDDHTIEQAVKKEKVSLYSSTISL